MDPYRIKRILTKLGDAWAANSGLTLGQLIEKVEDQGWQRYYDAHPTRPFSARLMNLPDEAFEAALNEMSTQPLKQL